MSDHPARVALKVFGTLMFSGVGFGFVYTGFAGGQPVAGSIAGVLAAACIALVWWKG